MDVTILGVSKLTLDASDYLGSGVSSGPFSVWTLDVATNTAVERIQLYFMGGQAQSQAMARALIAQLQTVAGISASGEEISEASKVPTSATRSPEGTPPEGAVSQGSRPEGSRMERRCARAVQILGLVPRMCIVDYGNGHWRIDFHPEGMRASSVFYWPSSGKYHCPHGAGADRTGKASPETLLAKLRAGAFMSPHVGLEADHIPY